MKYLKISSKGEVNPEAFSLLGASAKLNEDSIGLFGSGAKYAITSMLRNDIDFKIFSGEREIKVNTVPVYFRDKEFNKVVIDGRETSLTTRMGSESKDWDDPFSIFRELYSNAIDEGEDTMRVVDEVKGTADTTSIFIQYSGEFVELFENFSEYFTMNAKPLAEYEVSDYPKFTLRIMPKGKDKGVRIYRKNILAYSIPKDEGINIESSLFNYDISNVRINESRVLSNLYSVKGRIGTAWAYCNNLGLFKQYISGMEGGNAGKFEHECIPATFDVLEFHPDIKEYILSQRWVGAEHITLMNEPPDESFIIMPFAWIKAYMNYLPGMQVLGITSKGVFFTVITNPPEELENTLLDALDVLRKTAYAYKLKDRTFRFARFESSKTLGLAEDNTIYLSDKLVSSDAYQVAKIIIEEIEHLDTGHEDSSRAFQNHWIDLYFKELIRIKTPQLI